MKKQLRNKLGNLIRYIKIYFNLLKCTSFNAPKGKKIVFCCDGVISHGGWVDRLKGLMSSYYMAQETGRVFKIYFISPFKLSEFLGQNKVKWSYELPLRFNPFKSRVLYSNEYTKKSMLTKVKRVRKRDVFVYSNIDFLVEILDSNKYREFWQNEYFMLFKPNPIITNKVNLFNGTGRIVLHSRFTSLMGDFSDSNNLVMSEKEKEVLLKKLLVLIEDVKNKNKNADVYVLSDSKKFLEFVKQQCTQCKTLEGDLVHSDKEGNIEGHLKTLVDFYFIMQSEKVYLLKEGKMYNSKFSKYAALIADKPFEVIGGILDYGGQ